MDITQIIDDSCFIRVVWANNDSDNLNKTDVKFHLSGNDVFISDNSGYFQRLDYTKITSPVVASAIALRNAIKTFADTNPCSGGGGTGDVVGPASAVDNDIALFDGATGKLIKDSGVAIEVSLTPSSNATVPTSKAVATYVAGLIPTIVTGIYTPAYVAASGSNLDSDPTFDPAQYVSITDPNSGIQVVTVSGAFTINATLTLTSTAFKFDVPIPTTGTGSSSIRGTAANSLNDNGILLSPADGSILFQATPAATSSQKWSYQFTYSVN